MSKVKLSNTQFNKMSTKEKNLEILKEKMCLNENFLIVYRNGRKRGHPKYGKNLIKHFYEGKIRTNTISQTLRGVIFKNQPLKEPVNF